MKKINTPLVIGISIPIFMTIIVAASVYVPAMFIKPSYNFLYMSGGSSYEHQQYVVNGGRLTKSESDQAQALHYNPHHIAPTFYVHDVQNNKSTQLSFKEAQQLNLDPSITSPDGFKVAASSGREFLFRTDSAGGSIYLQGHNISKKLDLQLKGASVYDGFSFLGWVK